MRGIRNGAVGPAILALILASPGVALLMFIVLEMPIDLLMNLMALALLNLATVGALGWFLLQRQATPSNGAFILKHNPHSEERASVRAPLM
jgi:type IV secretory pathway protease TraF